MLTDRRLRFVRSTAAAADRGAGPPPPFPPAVLPSPESASSGSNVKRGASVDKEQNLHVEGTAVEALVLDSEAVARAEFQLDRLRRLLDERADHAHLLESLLVHCQDLSDQLHSAQQRQQQQQPEKTEQRWESKAEYLREKVASAMASKRSWRALAMRQRSNTDAGFLHRLILSWALQARTAALSQLRAKQDQALRVTQCGDDRAITQELWPLLQQVLAAWSTCASQSRMRRASRDLRPLLTQILSSWSRRAQRRRARRIGKAQGQSPESAATALTVGSGDDTAAVVTGSRETAAPSLSTATAEASADTAAAMDAAVGVPDSSLEEAAAVTPRTMGSVAEATAMPSTEAVELKEYLLELDTCRQLLQSPTDLHETASQDSRFQSQELAVLHSVVRRLSEDRVEAREATASQIVAWEAMLRAVEESRPALRSVAVAGEAAQRWARAQRAEVCWAQVRWAFATWHCNLCLNKLERASRLPPPPLWSGYG